MVQILSVAMVHLNVHGVKPTWLSCRSRLAYFLSGMNKFRGLFINFIDSFSKSLGAVGQILIQVDIEPTMAETNGIIEDYS